MRAVLRRGPVLPRRRLWKEATASLMLNPGLFENSRGGGFGVLEIIRGLFGAEDTLPPPSVRHFAPLKRSELRGGVFGPLASLRLTQVFGYTKAQCPKTLEAVYRFPLPGDAAVSSVRVRFGEVEIQARLQEREKAEANYEKAVSEGRQAALATRESPDVFTVQVAGIKPDEDIEIETSYVQLARAEGTGYSLRVPLTTAPRYVRAFEAEHSRAAQGQPLALLRDPGHRFSLDVTLSGADGAESLTHDLKTSEEGGGLRVQLAEGEIIPDRDFVMTWTPQRDEKTALRVWLHDDPDGGWTYFLALAAPPAKVASGVGPGREALVLVDHSGSMEGPKWEAADWTVKRFLLSLTGRDTFNLCLFHSSTRWFQKHPTDADRGAVQKAIDFLVKHRDSGGTELAAALEQALKLDRGIGRRARHVLIITDAQVSDEATLLKLADDESKHQQRRRISLVCVDAAPNSFLVHQLAESGGGAAKFLTSSSDEEDISTALDEVLADWAQPVLADLRLEADRPGAEAAGRASKSDVPKDFSAVDLGDLPSGRAVWVAGRVPRAEAEALKLTLKTGEGEEVASASLGEGDFTRSRPAIKALFGAWRILGLEHLINAAWQLRREGTEQALQRLGYNPDSVFDGLNSDDRENPQHIQKNLKTLLAKESLAYGVVSSETAFLAERSQKGAAIEATVAVANAEPAGWAEQSKDMLSAGSPTRTGGGGGGMAFAMAASRLMAPGGAPQMSPPPPPMPPSSPAQPSFKLAKRAPAPAKEADKRKMARQETMELQSLDLDSSAPIQPPTGAFGAVPPAPTSSPMMISLNEPAPPAEPAPGSARGGIGGMLGRIFGGGKKRIGAAEMRHVAQAPTQSYHESEGGALASEASITPAPDWDDEDDDASAKNKAAALPHGTLFSGVPAWEKAEAVLFDTDRPQDAHRFSSAASISRLKVSYPQGAPKSGELDGNLVLLIFVGDMAVPRAKVRLADLLDQNGERPLNISRQSGERVRVVLRDPKAAWSGGEAPSLTVSLDWR